MVHGHIGWLGAIFIGGFAGWIGSSLMKADTGVFLNIILGIVGASVASFLLGMVGVHFAGTLGYLMAGIAGAAIMRAGSGNLDSWDKWKFCLRSA